MEREPVNQAMQSEQQQDQPAFIVRAHHINIINNFLKSGMTVDDFIEARFRDLTNKRPSLSKFSGYPGYVKDVLGNTPQQAETFRSYEKEFLEEFTQLPDDYPVKLIQGQKDKICNGCAIGRHCNMKSLNFKDALFMRWFRIAAKKLNLEHDLTAMEDFVTFTGEKSGKVKSIVATAQTVKKVLASQSGSTLFSYIFN